MIKETVDAVRVAEMEADRQIATAKENAEGEKAQVKVKESAYREKLMREAKAQADKAMNEVVKKCNEYDLVKEKQIEKEVAELKAQSDQKINVAVDAVIDSLI
ncbi:MAG: hypothetical protein HFG28_10955 [Eubacterium sp.]|nr:hypothetical protein [Eubacterium sp.]